MFQVLEMALPHWPPPKKKALWGEERKGDLAVPNICTLTILLGSRVDPTQAYRFVIWTRGHQREGDPVSAAALSPASGCLRKGRGRPGHAAGKAFLSTLALRAKSGL